MLLDLNLPGNGGLELLRRMLLDDPSARILVLTMHANPLYATSAIELGAHGYLGKNVSAEELLAAVRRIANGGRTSRTPSHRRSCCKARRLVTVCAD